MSTVEEVVASADVPGIVVLAARGDDPRVTTAGPVRRNSLFRVASITKPVVAALAERLLAEGVMELDESVDRWLPELAGRRVLRSPDAALDDTVPAERPITVRDVLTYTTGYGMTSEMFADPPWPWVAAVTSGRLNMIGPPEPDRVPAPDAWLAELVELPLQAQPGERWLYHGSGQLLGVLLARVTGRGLPELLADRVTGPLGMVDTAFGTSATDRLVTAWSGGEVWDTPDGAWSRPPAFPDAAAGLVSTVDDLFAFARSLRDRPPMVRDQLTAAQRASAHASGFLSPELSWGYGVSVTVDGPRTGAFGWAGGLGTSLHADPVRDLVVVVLTQRLFTGPDDIALHTRIVDAAYAELVP
ncbi:serine hydrolase domain-containing protein [Actinomycetospora termitidis]|uniref:Serine hydrolase domain-containing protein n=1 Tax=Actinomycetospora termitidis TaxID=3053470 RepID=A0ABT7M1S7_9PSEU|nr:serine hydrolase domain-containing protein [Actinomycetospora sp. Odt1-22]MDL5154605.1 serine hydrolase domain-containing protein [Actinomycetospora sp. Odt1-22]